MTHEELVSEPMTVRLLAHTLLTDEDAWLHEGDDEQADFRANPRMSSDALGEFAGRSCYESWARPNPATATNESYMAHILEVGHESVLEHSSATFYITGVSRTLTHELVRHRHLSPSQRSQRYVDEGYASLVVPPDVAVSETLSEALKQHHADSLELYRRAVVELEGRGHTRKEARGGARAFLLNSTETRIVMSGNLRAWRDFLKKRWHVAAEIEIRTLASLILDELRDVAPHSVQDIPEVPFGS